MFILSWFSLQWKTKNNSVSIHILHFIKRKSKKILFIQQWYAPVLFMNKIANFTAIENEFLVSKETVVLHQWERSKQKFGFIKRVDKVWITTVKDLESWRFER